MQAEQKTQRVERREDPQPDQRDEQARLIVVCEAPAGSRGALSRLSIPARCCRGLAACGLRLGKGGEQAMELGLVHACQVAERAGVTAQVRKGNHGVHFTVIGY